MHGTRPPGPRNLHRATHIFRQRSDRTGHPRSLADGSRHCHLVEFLEAAATELPGRGVTRQQEQRALGTDGGE